MYLDQDDNKCCIWADIKKSGNCLMNGIDFFRSQVKDWSNSRLIGVSRKDKSVSYVEAYEARLVKLDSQKRKIISRKNILIYVNHQEEVTINRKEFCQLIDLMNYSEEAKRYYKEIAQNPKTTDIELDQILNELSKHSI